MGDTRFDGAYDRIRRAKDRARAIWALTDEELVFALASASKAHDALVANVLATEILNRQRQANAIVAAALAGGLFTIVVRTALIAALAWRWPEMAVLEVLLWSSAVIALGVVVGVATYLVYRRRGVPYVLSPRLWLESRRGRVNGGAAARTLAEGKEKRTGSGGSGRDPPLP